MGDDVLLLIACLQVNVTVEVTLEELYAGGLKKFEAVVEIWDGVVRGTKNRVFDVSLDQFIIEPSPDQTTQHTYIVYGMGSELFHRNISYYGNIQVRVKIAPHEIYHIDTVCFPHDLHATIYVSLTDYFRGRLFCLPHPSGRKGEIILAEYVDGKSIHLEAGKGIRECGDIHVHFELVFPQILGVSKEGRLQILREILDMVEK